MLLRRKSSETSKSPSNKSPSKNLSIPKLHASNEHYHHPPIVAIGDLHGDLTSSLYVLKMAGIINSTNDWIAGNTHFVQTGDIVDRGHDTIKLYKLMIKLTKQASLAGGKIYSLLGNHEVMNIMDDWRYVTPEDISSFGGKEKRKYAWSKDGWLGKYIRSLNLTTIVDNNVFVHGGIHANWAKLGVPELNQKSSDYLIHDTLQKLYTRDLFMGPDSPLWYRGYAQDSEATVCPLLEKALESLGVKRMIIGHTPQMNGIILPRCSGKVFVIDVGISRVYGGHHASLEIINDEVFGIYPNQKRIKLDEKKF